MPFAFQAEAGTHLLTLEGWKAELALERAVETEITATLLAHVAKEGRIGIMLAVCRQTYNVRKILSPSDSNIHSISKYFVFRCVCGSLPDWVLTSVNIIHELLQIRWNRMSLQLLDLHELDCIVEAVCTC